MKTLRRLMRASTFNGASSLLDFVKRGAWIGFIWTNFVAIITCGSLFAAVVAVIVYNLYRGARSDGALNMIGGLLGMYACMCGWGIVIGAVVGAARRIFHRVPDPGREAGG